MKSKLEKQLEELVAAEVISTEIAQKITTFYQIKERSKPNRLLTIFGVLGALLIGLGIILIIAHNWDNMSKSVKTIIAFVPLLIGQVSCAYGILRKKGPAWIEASTTFLVLAVGATISLISQVYHIPGDLSDFLLVWIAITAPLMYLLRSKLAVIIHLILATWYACNLGYGYNGEVPWWYLLQFAWIIPFYTETQKNAPESNFAGVLNGLVPLSPVFVMGAFTGGGTIAFLAYMGLFGLLYNSGLLPLFAKQKLGRNGLLLLGSLGTVFLSILLTFQWFWEDAALETHNTVEVGATIILYLLGSAVLFYLHLKKQVRGFNLFQYVFLIVGLLYLLRGLGDGLMMLAMNFLVAALGLSAIRMGAKRGSYGILNYGLVIITALIACRFFDTHLDFVVRGLLFVAVGTGFFLANYLLLKKQRTDSKKITSNTSDHV